MPLPVEPTSLQLTASYIGIAKDLGLLFAAVTTGTLAIFGFNRWRDETTFKAKFELAKEVVEASYKIRNITYEIKQPSLFMFTKPQATRIKDRYIDDLRGFLQHYNTLITQVEVLFNKKTTEQGVEVYRLARNVIMVSETTFDCIISHEEAKVLLRSPDLSTEEAQELRDTMDSDYEQVQDFSKFLERADSLEEEGEESLYRLMCVRVDALVESMKPYLKRN